MIRPLSKLFSVLLLFLTLGLHAQRLEYLSGINRLPTPAPNASSTSKSQLVLNLPFIDDFSYDGHIVNSNLWEASDVWVNQTWAISPITLGVATFDGLNRFGRAYSDVGNDSIADFLTSTSIDLSNPQDSVYLSFYYQAGGWGEMPGVGDDSLVLEFWQKKDSTWYSVWQNEDFPQSDWIQIMQAVDTSYFNDIFKFRFRNYGSKKGALDIWHIDYVRLDDQRQINDTLLSDIAFTRPHPSLLKNYEAIPWWHLNQAFDPISLANRDLRLFYRRNINPNPPRANRILGEYRISFQGTVIDQNGAPDGDLDDSHGDNIEVRFPVPDTADIGRPRLSFLNPPYMDEFEIVAEQFYSGGSQNYSSNDTLRRRQEFKNYYALDDGSAERSYEILNNRGGFIVQRYDILLNDTLKGLNLYFQPALHDLDDQEFTILIISNVGGLPGTIIYESDSVYTAQQSLGNFYQTYLLDTTLVGPVTSGTVFIGIRQQNSDPLSLGYDQNNRGKTTAFYGELDDLFQSFLGGTIMIRPIFRYIPRDLSVSEISGLQKLEIYPNPSNGRVTISLPKTIKENEQYQLKLINIQGQILAQKAADSEWDLSAIAPGLYLIRLEGSVPQTAWQAKIQIH
jgi:hypothetical protein